MSTQFGTVDGEWDVAANWSNGLPSATNGAVVSSTGGIPVLPAFGSAVCSALTGGGTIGLCGGAGTLTIGSQVIRLVTVEALENKNSGTLSRGGHG